MGVTGLLATCAAPKCWHSAGVAFDRLALPGATPFPSIVRARRFVCAACGGRVISIMPDWRRYKASGNARG